MSDNNKAEGAVQDAQAHQRLLDIAAGANVFEAIRQGLDDCGERPYASGTRSIR